ncbi:MAG: hypothetical protein JWP63_4900 [Candidatus Solibacter sp.]|jgi:hypothetical protein|nr:hypothetical protein [Candidatus Solibacter sp.]
MRLKISVLATGAILLNGKPADVEQLDSALSAARQVNPASQIWYYREAGAGPPPPQAKTVVQRIVQYKLPISLSSKPDFSDWVDAKGVSRPRTPEGAAAAIRMPDVSSRSDIHEVLAKVRAAANSGALVILKPDRTHLVMPRLPQSAELETMADQMNRMIPASTKRNIAAIAYTIFECAPGVAPTLPEISKAIPFLGILVGLSYIGHAVWIFEGHTSTLAAGCRDADVLLVDSVMRPLLATGWDADAARCMRNPNILVHDRTTFQLAAIRKAGEAADKLQFPN